MCPRPGRHDIWIFAAALLLLFVRQTEADDATYLIDPLGSYLEITAMSGADIEVQFPGSDNMTLQGAIDVRFHQDSIQLLDTTIVEAVPLARIMPRPGGRAGAEPASAGLLAEIPVALDPSFYLVSEGPVALRQIRGTLYSPPLPIGGDSFAIDRMHLALDKATLDYRLTGDLDFIGSQDLSGLASRNEAGDPGCFLRLGHYEYLSIPIAVTWEIATEELVFIIEAEGEIAAFRELAN